MNISNRTGEKLQKLRDSVEEHQITLPTMIGSAIKPAELNNNNNPLDSQKDEKSEGASQPV